MKPFLGIPALSLLSKEVLIYKGEKWCQVMTVIRTQEQDEVRLPKVFRIFKEKENGTK